MSFSLAAVSRAYSLVAVRSSRCSGFSCCERRLLGVQASVAASFGSQALEHVFSSCGAQV